MRRDSRLGQWVVVLLALTLLTVACAEEEEEPAALQTVRFAFDWFPTSGDVPVLAAAKFGWLAEEGIQLEITAGGEFDQVQSVGLGEHDITVGPGPSVLLSHAADLPVIAVGVTQPYSPVGLICRPDRGLDGNDPSTLANVKVGLQGFESYNTIWESYRNINNLTGLTEEVEVGFDPVVLFTGLVDCFPDFLTLVPALAAVEFGEPAVTFWMAESVESIGQTLITSDSFAAENPDIVKGFVRAYARGMQWALQNPSDAIDLMVETYPDVEREIIEVEAPALHAFWVSDLQRDNGLLYMDDSTWQPSLDVLVGFGFIDNQFDVGEVYTNDYLPDSPVMP